MHGWEDQRWTLARIRALISWQFQLDVSPAAVWRLMHRHGWSWQSPARRALERDEHEVDAAVAGDGLVELLLVGGLDQFVHQLRGERGEKVLGVAGNSLNSCDGGMITARDGQVPTPMTGIRSGPARAAAFEAAAPFWDDGEATWDWGCRSR